MIIDQFGVFFDDVPAAASMTSKAVSVQPYAGREDPVFISILAKGANSAAVIYTVSLQESADGGAFSTVASFTLAKPDAAPALKTVQLPATVGKRYVRLSVAASGASAGTLFAAVTRDHVAPYDKGLYIAAGRTA